MKHYLPIVCILLCAGCARTTYHPYSHRIPYQQGDVGTLIDTYNGIPVYGNGLPFDRKCQAIGEIYDSRKEGIMGDKTKWNEITQKAIDAGGNTLLQKSSTTSYCCTTDAQKYDPHKPWNFADATYNTDIVLIVYDCK